MNRWLLRIVGTSRHHAPIIALLAIVLTAASLWYAIGHLGIDTDTDHMFAASLPWRQREQALDRAFPQFADPLVAVVRGATPEETAQTAAALARVLRADPRHFRDVRRPGAGRFFRTEGLLLMPPGDLARLLDSLYAAQPLLGPLASDPSARGLLQGIALMAAGVRIEHAKLDAYRGPLEQMRKNFEAAASGHPTPLSWQSLLAGGRPEAASTVQLVLMEPVLDHATLQPGQAATDALQRIAQDLPDVRSGRVRIGYTGPVALSDAQFGTLAQGALGSTLGSLALLALWLYLALRSWRLIMPVLLTLLVGLALTLGFAALAIGTLNLISVAFAVLFVGLAVDFAIQFVVRLRDERTRHPTLADAIDRTARVSGTQIATAAVAIACGFLAFVPTSFVGVAELGLIAGVGMLLALLCTLALLPALLQLFRPRDQTHEIALPGGTAMDRLLQRRRRPVLALSALLAVAGLVAAATLPFDANPLHTQAQDSEPMRTLQALAGNPVTNPFNIDILAPDLAAARAISTRLSRLPEVASVVSGATFVPQHQPASLDQLAQAQDLLLPSLEPGGTPPALTSADLRSAIADTRGQIARAEPMLPADSPLRGIDAALGRLQHASDAQLLAMNAALVRFLPAELARLRDALGAHRIALDSLPPTLRRDWFTSDGRVRVQVSPSAGADDTAGLRRFVRAVRAVAPDAGGSAVTTVASADTILGAFRLAAALAALAIAVVLLLVLRHLRDTGIVLLTLGLSCLLTALLARLLGLSINYANIIALPLLLGVGVSFNVYFVMNWRVGQRHFAGSASGRAILFSALTTGTAFGSLALSHDPGMASMGLLLLLSLAAVLLATFVFLPALLYALTPPRGD